MLLLSDNDVFLNLLQVSLWIKTFLSIKQNLLMHPLKNLCVFGNLLVKPSLKYFLTFYLRFYAFKTQNP